MSHSEELSPRERRQVRTSEAILDAARHIIQHEGLDALSMRAIADRIDYSPATLYEYYGSKDEIVQAVCEQGHLIMRDLMAQVDMSLPVMDYVMEIGLVYIRFAVENPDYFRLMFTPVDFEPAPEQSAHGQPPSLPKMDVRRLDSEPTASEHTSEETWNGLTLRQAMQDDSSSFSILLLAIQRGIEEGVYKPKPDMGMLEMAYGCWSLVHGLATLRILHASRFPVDYTTTERRLLRQFGLGLAS